MKKHLFQRKKAYFAVIMEQQRLKYFSHYESKPYSDQQELITYSFNEEEKTITGFMEERGNQVYLYEYRGRLVGAEFFISFSKQSISYKLISISKAAEETLSKSFS